MIFYLHIASLAASKDTDEVGSHLEDITLIESRGYNLIAATWHPDVMALMAIYPKKVEGIRCVRSFETPSWFVT